MAHYAFVNSENMVVSVFVGRDENDRPANVASWETFYGQLEQQRCVRTSYNTRGGVYYTDGEPSADQSKAFRFNYAGIGYTYDETRDAFIPPKPVEGTWELDEATCLWVEVVEPSA